MLKKLISAVMAFSMAASLVVIPAHAAGFSSANIVYVDNWGWQKKWDSNWTMNSGTNMPSDQPNYFKSVEVSPNKDRGSGMSEKKKLLRLNSNYGIGGGDYDGQVNYVHSRFQYEVKQSSSNGTDILIDVNYYDGSNDGRIETLFRAESVRQTIYLPSVDKTTDGNAVERYAFPDRQGPVFVNFNTSTWNLNTIDLIADVDGQKPGTVYLFLNGKLQAINKVSKIDYDGNKCFHGYTISAVSGYWKKANDKFRFECSKASTCYANTDDYTVCLEDVINDQGLSDDISGINDPTMIMKTTDMETYMPGNQSFAFYGDADNSTDTDYLINPNVSYNADNTIATIAQNTESKTKAASMTRGAYVTTGSMGIGYSNYKNVARFIKISFDQTINSGEVEYGYENPSYTKGISFFKAEGQYLAVGAQGQSDYGMTNKTLRDVPYNAKAHIDWVTDTVSKTQYLYVNGALCSKGNSPSRINHIAVQTNGDANITLENWSMTLYNGDKQISEIEADMSGVSLYYPSAPSYEKVGDQLAVTFQANSTANFDQSGNTYVYTALFSKNKRLLDIKKTTYVEGRIVADEDENNIFDISTHPLYTDKKDDNKSVRRIATFIWSDANPQITKSEIWIGN